MSRTSSAQHAYAAHKAEFDRLNPQAKAALERETQLTKQIDLAKRVADRIEKRFYWAPLFETVVTAVPPNVQITRLSGDVGRDSSRQQCQITLEGLAAGPEPRAAAEEMRRSIGDRIAARYNSVTATFRNLDDGTETARLDGKVLPTVVFTIHVTFKTGADPVPVQKPLAQRK
jgi:Tfp pilus assembly protein PilN